MHSLWELTFKAQKSSRATLINGEAQRAIQGSHSQLWGGSNVLCLGQPLSPSIHSRPCWTNVTINDALMAGEEIEGVGTAVCHSPLHLVRCYLPALNLPDTPTSVVSCTWPDQRTKSWHPHPETEGSSAVELPLPHLAAFPYSCVYTEATEPLQMTRPHNAHWDM